MTTNKKIIVKNMKLSIFGRMCFIFSIAIIFNNNYCRR